VPAIRVNLPADVHAVLLRRAGAAGQPLEDYVLGRLVEDARQETLDEVLDRAGARPAGR